jgi:hypothetical protein
MQQRSALMAIQMSATKKNTEKILVQRSTPYSSGPNTTKITPKIHILQKQRLQVGNSAQTPSSS